MGSPVGLSLLGALALSGCGAGAAPRAVTLQPPAAMTQAPAPVKAPVAAGPLFPEEPALAELALRDAAFVQETWTGAGNWQQHCREFGFEAARSDEVARRTNAKLAARGVDAKLPETKRWEHHVIAIGASKSDLLPRPGLAKLVVCTEGMAPRAEHDRFVATLRKDPLAPEFPFGDPDLAWRRVHADGRVELGFRWTNPGPGVDAALEARGYVQDASKPTVYVRPNELVRAEMRGAALWWSAAR